MKRRDFNKLAVTTAAATAASPYFSKVVIAADEIDSPYLFERPFAPTSKEVRPTKVSVLEGKIPKDLAGTYFRNGPNQVFLPKDPYHWFDGDGMVHAVSFKQGSAKYYNKLVRTKKLEKETAANKSLYSGFKAKPAEQNLIDYSMGLPIYPDTSNTCLVSYGGQLFSLRAPLGEMYEIDQETLDTNKVFNFDGRLKKYIAAHSKIDPHTGEFVFFGFDLLPRKNGEAYVYNGVVSKDGDSFKEYSFKIDGSKNMHDFAITKNYSIVLDQPLLVTSKGLEYQADRKSRFGFIKKSSGKAIWIESDADYIIHTANAYEENNKIILRACEVTNLENPRSFGNFRLETKYTEWVFCLEQKQLLSKKILMDKSVDFPTINNEASTKRNRYTYLGGIQNESSLYEIDSLIKYCHQTKTQISFCFEKNIKGNEFSFVSKQNAVKEDDGYLIGFTQNIKLQSSELYIINAKALDLCARLYIPNTVPAGFHGTWVE